MRARVAAMKSAARGRSSGPRPSSQGAGAGRFAWNVAARPVSKTVVVSEEGWETYTMAADTRTAARMNAAEAMNCATQLS